MWSTALSRTHRRTPGWSSGSLHGSARTRTLEDRLAALRHCSSGRSTGSCTGNRPRCNGRRRRRSIHRARAGLRNNQTALRSANRLARANCRRSRTRGDLIRRHHGSGTHRGGRDASRCRRNCRGRGRCCHRRRLRRLRRRRRCDLRFCGSDLVFDDWLRRLHHCRGLWRSRRRRFRRNDDRSRRTSHRLRRNEPRSRFRLGRSNWRDTSHRCCRSGRNSGRRSNSRARRLRGNLGGRTCRHVWLGGLLRNRLQHVSWFGDVRQVDLGLELINRRAVPRAAGRAGLAMLLVIVFDLLGFVDFD